MDVQTKKLSKKEIRNRVYDKLAAAMEEFKGQVKEKRFASNLKKASRMFADDLVKGMKKTKKEKKVKPAKNKLKVKKEVMNATNGAV